MNKHDRCPRATVVWVDEYSRRRLPALDQKRIAELVAAVAALLGRSADACEPVVVGRGALEAKGRPASTPPLGSRVAIAIYRSAKSGGMQQMA
jgi:hypothetical protein